MPISNPGSAILYRAHTGLEGAMADADAERLLAIEAELIIDQWDPYRVSTKNLPYLAFAMGVNLWSDTWDDAEKRDWVARQWYIKSIRGTPEGLREFVEKVGGKIRELTRPPATFFWMEKFSAVERAAFYARFPQLRIYPFVRRVDTPGVCILGTGFANQNGRFWGPLKKLFFTNIHAAGRYTRTATLWDRDVETPLTFREIKKVAQNGTVTVQDEIALPGITTDKFFWDHSFWSHGFYGRLSPIEQRLIVVPREEAITFDQPQAQYTTIYAGLDPLHIYPEHVTQQHDAQAGSLFHARNAKQFWGHKFWRKSIAWQYLYERWFLNDPTRMPDQRHRSVHWGHARFGIPAYTAEAKIKISKIENLHYFRRFWGFGVWKPPDHSALDRMGEAVRASKALRDTILINTLVSREIMVADGINADGAHYVGEIIET